ncbi:MAG: divalent-cation tolerance protein CutA [Saprospiraceae bacterium]|nr:divalent-cation tolerance protein CutA [Saprospiraceae bacterium]
MKITIFYVPFPDQDAALTAIEILLKAKYIACGNVIVSTSLYHWQGEQSKNNEHIAILKTLPEKKTILEKRISEIHTYDVPAILSWEADANESYYEWMVETMKEEP